MRVRFLEVASDELLNAVNHFEGQQLGLGERFERTFWRAVESIRQNPEAWQRITKRARCRIIRRFQFGIVYAIRDDEILIVAVMHLHRQPGYWRDRIA